VSDPRSVGVIIAAYNAEATIGRAVRSALAEVQARQVIVVDDGSTDSSYRRALAEDDGSGRLQVLRTPQSGPAAARNRAIGAADTTWVCPLDADDYFTPGRLGRLLDEADGCDLVADDLLLSREGDNDSPPGRLIGERLPLPAVLSFADFVAGNISRRGYPRREFGFLKPLLRRDFLARARLAYDERLRLGEDFVLYATALARGGRLKVTPPCGYVAVERGDSLSARHTPADLGALLGAVRDLERHPSLSAVDLAAVRALRRQVAAKLRQREALELKASAGPFAAAWMLARAPDVGAHAIVRLAVDAWDHRRRAGLETGVR
jgi:succinoglycan biosynthesis protein ExoU